MARQPNLTEAARALGRRGGKAGTGASKRRGGSAYYRRLGAGTLTDETRAKAIHVRRVKAARRMLSEPGDDVVLRERIAERWGEDVLREAYEQPWQADRED